MTESPTARSFKAKINNYAKKYGLPSQVVLQNYMFERFLERLSVSEYRNKFVIKGGILISVLVGLQTRSTMDLDATARGITLTEENITAIIGEICGKSVGDNIVFSFVSVAPIRKDDEYGGYRVRFNAVYESLITPLSIDISTGDVITPKPVKYNVSGIFDGDLQFSLWGYNTETILAEKAESILSHGVLNTRTRDFYDIYILCMTKEYDKAVFKEALIATSKHRGTFEKIADIPHILDTISTSSELKKQWEQYRAKFSYTKNISYEQTVEKLRKLLF